MKRIVIIGVYFGKFPDFFELWLKSCSYNDKIDFFVFTDQKIHGYPKNMKVIKMTMSEFSELARQKLNLSGINITRAYKCCDFKPVYGIILEDYIKQYDYWGHCDFDLIFGDILANIDKKAWDQCDKILPLGHLSFYRNTREVNDRYKLKSATASYKEIFTSDKSYAFDEFTGMMYIYQQNGFPFYEKRVFADIDSVHKRFRLSMNDRNYRHQVFYWEKGHIYKAYIEDDLIKKSEYAYIHFKKRKNMPIKIVDVNSCEEFFVTRYGFIEKPNTGLPSIKEIKKYNPYRGFLYERYEYYRFRYNNMMRKIKRYLTGANNK